MSSSFDPSALREQFPALHQQVHGGDLIYFDNAATTQKPLCVIEAMNHYYRHHNANVHRASHALSAAATRDFEGARGTVQQFINADRLQSIVWTRGTTEAINLVAQSWGRANLTATDDIILSEQEHHANIVPWQLLAEAIGFTIQVIPILPSGELDLNAYQALLCDKTKLVSVCHVSNALGIINPVEKITQLAHAIGAKVLVDGAQAVAHLTIDVQAIDCDFYAFSGHKVFGPTGIGVLYGKPELLEAMPPWQGGGEMIEQVSFTGTRFQKPPFKFEAGTPAIAEAIGLATAIDFLGEQQQAQAYEQSLLTYARQQLEKIKGISFYGDTSNKVAVISFIIAGHHQKDIASALDHHGIAIRAGHHCTMPLMQALGINGTLRIALAFYNTFAEVDALVVALLEIISGNTDDIDQVPAGTLEILRNEKSWDARYRQLMLLGKKAALADHPHKLRTEENLIAGCESQAWLSHSIDSDSLEITFYADSDAKIIRGLLTLVLDICNGKTAQQIAAVDFDAIFLELGLQQHLSPSRGNGLLAIIGKVKNISLNS